MFQDGQVNLYSGDVAKALAFWRDLLGFAETYRFPRTGEPEHVELRLGSMTVALTSAAGLVTHRLPPASRGEPFEIAIRAEDTGAAVALLRAAGVEVMLEPAATPAGNRVAYVRDPDGNRIQIYSRDRPPPP
jgi:lactoylglutathione lyase